MSGELYTRGSWEVMAPTDPEADLNLVTLTNFQERGRKAGHLVLAALTESVSISGLRTGALGAYLEDGPTKSVTDVELYTDSDESEVPVDIERTLFAAHTLQEYLVADSPGTRRVRLESFDTRYERVWKHLIPGRRDNDSQKVAFGDAMMDSLRTSDLPLRSPDQARLIIKAAPRSLSGLRLTDHGPRDYGETRHDVITASGRLVTVRGTRRYGNAPSYWLPHQTDQIRERGGKTPGQSTIRSLRERIVSLRTAGSKR